MRKAVTTRYDFAEHLRTPEEMAAYLEAVSDDRGITVVLLALMISGLVHTGNGDGAGTGA